MKRSILALIGSLWLIAPILVKAVTYTHFVSPNGSATSQCTQQEPCSLTRAVALAGSASMPPGSTVLVQRGADGIYSQAALTFAGSGAAGNPIKFIGETGVRITGTRVKPDPASWTLVPGRQYTYQLDWDEAAQFSALPAQRPPVANWRPIWVEDRRPPFTTPSSRRFDLWFPPLYSARTSINAVEAQAGTAWQDTANNKLYVHLFDDTAPPRDGTNLYLTSSGWGTLTINGDYIWLENLTIEHATPEGLRVNTSAIGTVLKRITALATSVNLRGTNTLAEDLNVSHVIRQRTDPTECYDANPSFGVGECWNANAYRGGLDPRSGRKRLLRRAGRPPGLRAPLVERRQRARTQHARALEVVGVSESYVGGQRKRWCDPTQCVFERPGLDLFRAQ